MMTVLAPQKMPDAIVLGHCTGCGRTTFVVRLRRASDPVDTSLCAECLHPSDGAQ